MEVYASTTGVEAVLFQQQGNPPRLHPFAFFSQKFNSAERNYNIGKQELLAIKLALEEWRHWLEGAHHQFTVWTHHKNLQYLSDSKWLNPHQARWALFFTRLDFKIAYPPGSKNSKADALSCIHSTDYSSEKSEQILDLKTFINPIQWTPLRKTKPVPQRVHHQAVLLTGNMYQELKGPNSSIQLIPLLVLVTQGPIKPSHYFKIVSGGPAWNKMRRSVRGCTYFAISKSPHHLPSGKILPLHVPNRPWSHLGVDFITDLPLSQGNTCIFVTVDKLSKSCRLIPLKGLPTAMEVAKLSVKSVNHWFRESERIWDSSPTRSHLEAKWPCRHP